MRHQLSDTVSRLVEILVEVSVTTVDWLRCYDKSAK